MKSARVTQEHNSPEPFVERKFKDKGLQVQVEDHEKADLKQQLEQANQKIEASQLELRESNTHWQR